MGSLSHKDTESCLLRSPFKDLFLLYMYKASTVPASMCVQRAHVGGQEKVLGPLELELQMRVSCLKWMLGTKQCSPGGAASALS